MAGITDRGVAALLGLNKLTRLALGCTSITDAALDYLTYYTRYPDAGKSGLGVSALEWLELSNTRYTPHGFVRIKKSFSQCPFVRRGTRDACA